MFNRTFVFLLVHAVILTSLFVLKFLGIAADIILVVAASVIAMEAVYMAVFTKEAAVKASSQLREAASETVKLERALLYAGHQIKNIQSELDVLKRKADFKSNGNSHQKRMHHPIISHS